MTELRREYVVPLRRKTKFAPKWRRSKKAVSVLNEFIKKHMKTDTVIICKELNEKIWENGIKNPPGKVSVVAVNLSVNGKNKTLVNLLSVGIENQLKHYALDSKPETNKKEEVSKVDEKETVVEAEVKEVKKEAKSESKKEEVKNE